jgi:hypothetical protein
MQAECTSSATVFSTQSVSQSLLSLEIAILVALNSGLATITDVYK